MDKGRENRKEKIIEDWHKLLVQIHFSIWLTLNRLSFFIATFLFMCI